MSGCQVLGGEKWLGREVVRFRDYPEPWAPLVVEHVSVGAHERVGPSCVSLVTVLINAVREILLVDWRGHGGSCEVQVELLRRKVFVDHVFD